MQMQAPGTAVHMYVTLFAETNKLSFNERRRVRCSKEFIFVRLNAKEFNALRIVDAFCNAILHKIEIAWLEASFRPELVLL